MTSLKISVKWNRKTLRDIDVDTSEPVELFKTQLWTLTGVPPDRQTLMVKGKKLQDGASWDSTGVKNKAMILMMGSAEELPSDEKMDIVFAEDRVNENGEQEVIQVKRGLLNVQNTCYVNSTLQCLNEVKELKHALMALKDEPSENNPQVKLGQKLYDVLQQLDPDTPGQPVLMPQAFIDALRAIKTEYAERNEHGMHIQQDAEECWSLILSQMAQALAKPNQLNPIDQLFGVTVEETSTCKEDTNEVITESRKDWFLRLHIHNKTSHLFEGLLEAYEEDMERNSVALGRNAQWRKESRITRLPPYLGIHFVRFEWKLSVQVKAKVLRNVSYPFTLDVIDLCSDELKEKIGRKRDAMRKKLDAEVAESVGKGTQRKDVASGSSSTATEVVPDAEMTIDGKESEKVGEEKGDSETLEDLLTEGESGVYELVGVLTHRGRTLDSGHYIAWCKDDKGDWYKYDDDEVTPQKEEDIEKLSGGRDWHVAYLCLYRSRTAF